MNGGFTKSLHSCHRGGCPNTTHSLPSSSWTRMEDACDSGAQCLHATSCCRCKLMNETGEKTIANLEEEKIVRRISYIQIILLGGGGAELCDFLSGAPLIIECTIYLHRGWLEKKTFSHSRTPHKRRRRPRERHPEHR